MDIKSDVMARIVADILNEAADDSPEITDFDPEGKQPIATSVRMSNRTKYWMEVIRGWLIDQGYTVSQNQFITTSIRVMMIYLAKRYRDNSPALRNLFMEMELHQSSEQRRHQYQGILTYMEETRKSVKEAMDNRDVALAVSLLESWKQLAETKWGDWRDGVYSRGYNEGDTERLRREAHVDVPERVVG